jgi:hypothetical protein
LRLRRRGAAVQAAALKIGGRGKPAPPLLRCPPS